MIETDFSKLENLIKDFSKELYKYPSEVNKFMQQEVSATAKAVEKQEDARWKVAQRDHSSESWWMPFRKGRYKKSSERNGIKSWWVLKNKVWYERLINDGHRIVRGGKVVGYVHPNNFIDRGVKNYEPTMLNHFENFAGRILNAKS